MATKIKIEWVDEGFAEILQSADLASVCLNAAQQIATRAGEGYAAKPWVSRAIGRSKADRVAALVVPENYKAMLAEATDKVLTKAVH